MQCCMLKGGMLQDVLKLLDSDIHRRCGLKGEALPELQYQSGANGAMPSRRSDEQTGGAATSRTNDQRGVDIMSSGDQNEGAALNRTN